MQPWVTDYAGANIETLTRLWEICFVGKENDGKDVCNEKGNAGLHPELNSGRHVDQTHRIQE